MTLFWNYIAERHRIYKKKETGESWPWTEDRILQEYKFTNVFRDLDTGTKYLIEKILLNLKSLEAVIFNCIIYRIYNKIETMEAIGIQEAERFDVKKFKSKLRIQKKKKKIFTNAFIVPAYNFIKATTDKIGKTAIIINDLSKNINVISNDIEKKRDSQYTVSRIKQIEGIGTFLSYQIAVDIGYWDKEIFNESEFTVAGPGARRGINRIFESRGDYSYERSIQYLCEIQDEWFEKINVNPKELFSDRKEPSVNLMATENCLCEISKYLKVHYSEGRPRNKYRNEKAVSHNF